VVLENIFFQIDWYAVLRAIIVLVVGFIFSWFIRLALYKSLIKILPLSLTRTISRAVYYVLIFLVIITVLSMLGIDLTGFVVAGGIVGIILGFALQNTIANLFSGIFLQWEKPFKIGSYVRIGDIEGFVSDVSIMSTKIRGLDGTVTRIPNYSVFQSNIINYHALVARRLEFIIGIAYKEDVEKAYEVIRKVLESHPLILVNPEPEVFVRELGSSSVDIAVRVWVPNIGMIPWIVRRELLWLLKKAITEEGIEIPFIQNDVWFRSPLKIEIERISSKQADEVEE